MLGLEEALADLARDGGVAMALLIAVLLGLRHATDPDHLTAVSALVLSDERPTATRRAGVLGLAWGAGHAITLLLLGLPVVLAGPFLPDAVQRGAEVAVGALIVALAVRLLVRWRRGYFHAHVHSHGGVTHAHPHAHEHARPHAHGQHEHEHEEALGRTPLAALGMGLVHGAGGSAAAGILLVSAIPGRLEAVVGLVVFAVGSAVAMWLASWGFGSALARRPVLRRLTAVVPVFGVAMLLFGAWYALGALETVPYYF